MRANLRLERPVIYFRSWGSTKYLGSADFQESAKILLRGNALKFEVIFQKFALELLKIQNSLRKYQKNANFLFENLTFCVRRQQESDII